MVTGFVLDCSTSLISMVMIPMMVMMGGGDDDDDGDDIITAVVFGHCHQPGACVLAVPRFGCCLDCA